MKVGTDGVLLGAWASLPLHAEQPVRVLDIGTGSGLVALMLAQRLEQAGVLSDRLHIDAIDIDADAASQAAENFAASPWSDCLHARCVPLQDFLNEEHSPYDLIACNPPFYSRSLTCPDTRRTAARHTAALDHGLLLHATASLLAHDGLFSLILPADAENEVMRLSAACGLPSVRLCRVHGTASKPAKRLLAEFRNAGTKDSPSIEPPLVLTGEGVPRSTAYTALTRDFYL